MELSTQPRRRSRTTVTATRIAASPTSAAASRWREIRQRGSDGPPPPDPVPEGLDEQTAQGASPVLMIWCRGETNGQGVPFPVPDAVWRNMIRDWED